MERNPNSPNSPSAGFSSASSSSALPQTLDPNMEAPSSSPPTATESNHNTPPTATESNQDPPDPNSPNSPSAGFSSASSSSALPQTLDPNMEAPSSSPPTATESNHNTPPTATESNQDPPDPNSPNSPSAGSSSALPQTLDPNMEAASSSPPTATESNHNTPPTATESNQDPPDPNSPDDRSDQDPKQDGEEDEEEECGFCLFMKGGGCKDQFIAWENCVEEAEKIKGDVAEKCFEITSLLKKCMDAHAEYYEPILRAEQAMSEDAGKESIEIEETIIEVVSEEVAAAGDSKGGT